MNRGLRRRRTRRTLYARRVSPSTEELSVPELTTAYSLLVCHYQHAELCDIWMTECNEAHAAALEQTRLEHIEEYARPFSKLFQFKFALMRTS